MRQWLLVILVSQAIAGCIPPNKTRYELTPPTSRSLQPAKFDLIDPEQEYERERLTRQRDMDRYEADLRLYEMETRQSEVLQDLHSFACERDGQNSASCLQHPSMLYNPPTMLEPRKPDPAPVSPAYSPGLLAPQIIDPYPLIPK